jgi:phosphomevalonate kinase
LFERALSAHRKAQGGGSGVDVAASTFGGTLSCRPSEPLLPVASAAALDAPLRVDALTLPRLALEIWASPSAANTSHYIRQVSAWGSREPAAFAALFERLTQAAELAVSACTSNDPGHFVKALNEQALGLLELGEQSGTAIFLPELVPLAERARFEGGCLLPAGAGGGDISLFAGLAGPSPELVNALRAAGLTRLTLRFDAPGVHWV